MEVVAASPNNTYFASGGWDNKICIYKNDSTFELAQQLDGHNAAVSALAFSRDGKSLISGGKDYKVIIPNTCRRRVWPSTTLYTTARSG